MPDCRRILFTAAQGGIGCSFVAANTALALARAGNRVLLVDASPLCRTLDLRLGCADRIVYDLDDLCAGRCAPLRAVLTVLPQGGEAGGAASVTDAADAAVPEKRTSGAPMSGATGDGAKGGDADNMDAETRTAADSGAEDRQDADDGTRVGGAKDGGADDMDAEAPTAADSGAEDRQDTDDGTRAGGAKEQPAPPRFSASHQRRNAPDGALFLLPGSFRVEDLTDLAPLCEATERLCRELSVDFLIFDAPATAPLLRISPFFDTVCLLSAPDRTGTEMASHAAAALRRCGARNVYLIVNRFRLGTDAKEAGQPRAAALVDAAGVPLLSLIPCGSDRKTDLSLCQLSPSRKMRKNPALRGCDNLAARLSGKTRPLLNGIVRGRRKRRRLLY